MGKKEASDFWKNIIYGLKMIPIGFSSLFGADVLVDTLLNPESTEDRTYEQNISIAFNKWFDEIERARKNRSSEISKLNIPSQDQILRIQKEIESLSGIRIPSVLKSNILKKASDLNTQLRNANIDYERSLKAYDENISKINSNYEASVAKADVEKDLLVSRAESYRALPYKTTQNHLRDDLGLKQFK